jgi:glycosyltransferase involved in cell wall biosynthesis
MKNIIFADCSSLRPNRDGGSLRIYNILNIFIELGYNITYLNQDISCDQKTLYELKSKGVQIITSSWEYFFENIQDKYEIAIVSRFGSASRSLHLIKKYCKSSKIIFDTVDMESLRQKRQSEILNDKKSEIDSINSQSMEDYIMHNTDATWIVSTKEKEIISFKYPEVKTYIIPTIQGFNKVQGLNENRKNLIFIGGFKHYPNVDAVKYFISDILPIVSKEIEDVKLDIIGEEFPINSIYLPDNVKYHGHVDNLDELFNSARLSVAPLRFGAGVKCKINMSMSYGVPVVTTSIGAEGMNIINGYTALIADNPVDFAKSIIKIYNSDELWTLLSKNGLENVERYFSIDSVKNKISNCFNELS